MIFDYNELTVAMQALEIARNELLDAEMRLNFVDEYERIDVEYAVMNARSNVDAIENNVMNLQNRLYSN